MHGGGFYRVEKFRVAPERLPEPLHWFKWEAYTTWLSGFALFVVVYYSHASSYLDRPDGRRPDGRGRRSRISVGGLVLAWLVYDGLCRAFANDEGVLAVLVFAFICAVGLGRVRAVRAARRVPAGRRDDRDDDGRQRLLRDHPGALEAGPREGSRRASPTRAGTARQDAVGAQQLPDAAGRASRCSRTTSRSRTGTRTRWLVLVALMAIGALTRHYFNLRHRGLNVWPILGVAAAGIVAARAD